LFSEYLRLDEIQRVADVLEVVKYPKGARIITKGDVGTTFYIIKEGAVLCTDIGAGDNKFPDVIISAGRYFGERALISSEPRAATVMATEEVTLLSLNGQNFKALLGGLNGRMAAVAEKEDEDLKTKSTSLLSMFTGSKPLNKSGWTYTSRPDIQLDALQEVAKLGSGSFGFVRSLQPTLTNR
jgi:CRP-like cAMP-binding protein